MRILLPLVFFTMPAWADPAEVVGFEATASGAGFRFDVALAHGDTGWDDYADGWRIEDESGNILAERPLAHPHVEEQPFTRSTTARDFPSEISVVYVRSRTNVDGWDSRRFGPYVLTR